MSEELTLRGFFREHFLGFIAGILAAYFSLGLCVVLAFVTYFEHLPLADSGMHILLMGAVLTLLIVHGNLMVLWGRPQWVWLLVGVFVACLLFVLPMITYDPHRGLYGLALLFPLLGLLFLNSQGQRDMRRKLVDIRQQRETLRRALARRRA
ncbi:hypothetical protein [Pseudomonas gingeri]|uniref:Uncharacterized protein n=1 Tax=Pseudomonas gingeri TaxID=117681 RepID=A0A7Y7WMD8_9PSED|nr:hypothetical protein [Pseudomonas gingeri]